MSLEELLFCDSYQANLHIKQIFISSKSSYQENKVEWMISEWSDYQFKSNIIKRTRHFTKRFCCASVSHTIQSRCFCKLGKSYWSPSILLSTLRENRESKKERSSSHPFRFIIGKSCTISKALNEEPIRWQSRYPRGSFSIYRSLCSVWYFMLCVEKP